MELTIHLHDPIHGAIDGREIDISAGVVRRSMLDQNNSMSSGHLRFIFVEREEITLLNSLSFVYNC